MPLGPASRLAPGVGLAAPACDIGRAGLAKFSAAGVGHEDHPARHLEVAQGRIAAFGRHLAEAAERCRNQIVEALPNQLAPGFWIAVAGGVVFAAGVAFVTGGCVNFGTGLVVGAGRQAKHQEQQGQEAHGKF